MLYWKYSANRVFILNEYWIFIPAAILANLLIIPKIRSHKEKTLKLQELKKELEKLLKKQKEQLEHQQKMRRILCLSLGLNGLGMSYFLLRGGANFIDFIDTDYILEKCEIEEGLRFLDNDRLRKIIHDLYRHKRKGRLIYITATAVCQLANIYGQTFLALPFAVGDFGVTNLYQTVRKLFVTVLLGAAGPLFILGNPVAIAAAILLGLGGLRLAFTNLERIATSPVLSAEDLKPRIADLPDVVVVNSRNKVLLKSQQQGKKECWLPDQALFNPNCQIKSTQIPEAIDLVSTDLKYDEVVNVQDVTALEHVKFTDVLDLGKPEPSIPEPRKGKMVNFLDKFADSGTIRDQDTWDTVEPTDIGKRNLRTR